jgi:hypothetical protein
MNIRLSASKDKDQVLKLFDEFRALQSAKDVPSEIGSAIFEEVISDNNNSTYSLPKY